MTVLVAAHACSVHDWSIWQYCVSSWRGVWYPAVIHIHAWCHCCCRCCKSQIISLVFPLLEHANTVYVSRSYSINCNHPWLMICLWYPYLSAWCIIIFAGNILDDHSPVNTIQDFWSIYFIKSITWLLFVCWTISIVSHISCTMP